MTQNQISFAKAKEDARHNKASEKLSAEQNKINKQHLKRQDAYTSAHYERSDQASLISANASALNAQASAQNAATNKSKYEMEYDIEYGWTQQPLQVSWMDPETGASTRPGEGTVVYNYPKGMPLSAQVKDAQAMQNIYTAVYMPKEKEVGIAREVTGALKDTGSAFQNVMSSIFGKSGLYGALSDIIAE